MDGVLKNISEFQKTRWGFEWDIGKYFGFLKIRWGLAKDFGKHFLSSKIHNSYLKGTVNKRVVKDYFGESGILLFE